MRNEQKLNSSDYEQIYYVDSINGNDFTGSGSKLKPYKTIETLFKNMKNLNKNTLIYLNKGNYYTTEEMFEIDNNCIFTIKGKNEDTILVQNQRIGETTGNTLCNNKYTLILSNLIYTSNKDLPTTNTVAFGCTLYMYNVVFKNIIDSKYGFFLPHTNNKLIFYNCTKTESSENFLRGDCGIIKLYNCYGAFTSGNGTSQSNWDENTNIILSNPQLDVKYRIINTTQNKTYGVYSGIYLWGKLNKFLVKQNDNYYAISSNFYQLGQPKDESELVEWYEKCGVDDPNEIMKPIDNQEVSMSKDDKDIWTTDIPIDFNKVADDIELVENDDRKSIKYGCKTYRIYDLLDDEFQFVMSEEK